MTRGSTRDPLWYKDAIVYQLHVRTFQDSDGDGIGDFRGLAQRLGYIRDLGVTAVWLLPFYPSPLRDDGYDIADYESVHPSYGTLDDFRAFLEEAHRLGLRVVTELVVNHTSDQHGWFRRARRAPAGSPERDFYVWSDDPHRFREARIIFRDFESSNWEWDPVAEAYYWHRFYKHQPDLNFDNAEVRAEVLRVLDFWLEMGVDGLRLDAVPYLVEREGTTCENLPETHAVLKELRAHVDRKYDARMLLAEANQWPEDAAAYFGDGDECHACFHFPLMPRLYVALEREDRFPIVDILEQTPAIPDVCQWITFLRNHDELTLEMVTDEDRDYMYRSYAADPRARINLGIRRRLAPLMGGDRRRIELLNVLLFCLPGTPVIYYGDEIGMGDNIYLGDRDAVRTPMQWSFDRNAGFSKANPQQLCLPVVSDPAFHPAAVNVEAQEANPTSQLSWTKRLVALVRRRYRVFGRGSAEFLHPENPRVLTFVRRYEDETALVVANLSRFSQFVELDLSRFQGAVPLELFGGTRFPPVGDLPYMLTLGPHACYLFSLETPSAEVQGVGDLSRLETIDLPDDWEAVLRGRSREELERRLPEFMLRRRWLPSARPQVRNVRLEDVARIERDGHSEVRIVSLRVEQEGGETLHFCVPLACGEGRWAQQLLKEHPGYVVVSGPRTAGDDAPPPRLLYDAGFETPLATTLLRRMLAPPQSGGAQEVLRVGYRAPSLAETARSVPAEPVVRWLRDEPAADTLPHETFSVDDQLVLTLFRRLEPGPHADVEFGRFLQERAPESFAPRLHASLEVALPGRPPSTLAVLRDAVGGEGSGADVAEHHFRAFLERVPGGGIPPEAGLPVPAFWLGRGGETCPGDCPPEAWQLVGTFLQDAEVLGDRVAGLHAVLASAADEPTFAPEPFTPFTCRELYQSLRNGLRRTFERLRLRRRDWNGTNGALADRVLGLEQVLLHRFRDATPETLVGRRIRCHGDLRADRIACVGDDFRFVDFSGDPVAPYGERRLKRSPLWDVATLVVSLQRIARRVLTVQLGERQEPTGYPQRLATAADFWLAWTSGVLLRHYFLETDGLGVLPKSDDERRRLFGAFVLHATIADLDRVLSDARNDPAEPLQAVEWSLHAIDGSCGLVPDRAPVKDSGN